mgnify:FL=1
MNVNVGSVASYESKGEKTTLRHWSFLSTEEVIDTYIWFITLFYRIDCGMESSGIAEVDSSSESLPSNEVPSNSSVGMQERLNITFLFYFLYTKILNFVLSLLQFHETLI